MNTESKKAQLKHWSELLLDTGKRNRLINFVDTKSSTLEIVCPDVRQMFSKCEGYCSLEVIDIKEDEITFYSDEEDQSEKKHLSRSEFIEKFSSKANKPNKILLYNANNTPIQTIKNIHKKAKSSIEETGVNIAYIAFGFIHWKESDNSSKEFCAPILLVPISFKNESSISPYFIETNSEDYLVNPTFNYKLQTEHGFSLPEYEGESFDDYFSKVDALVSKINWKVSCDCKIGLFSFLKMNMYRDLQENANKILNSPFILSLLGDIAVSNYLKTINDSEVENPLIDLHTVVDADSSQIEAIEMAKAGNSFVLQGPPGTGKSQTITNIIAECLHDGKKVLFVSEKQAALNVVYDKLKKAGLNDFCLELHSYKANKKVLIDELYNTLHAQRSAVSSRATDEISQKEAAQLQLDSYVDILHKKQNVINKSLYQLFECQAKYRNSPDINYSIRNIESKDESYLNTIVPLLDQYETYVQNMGIDYRKSPWFGYSRGSVDYQTLSDFETSLNKIISVSESLLTCFDDLNESFSITADTLQEANKYPSFFEALDALKLITPRWISADVISTLYPTVHSMGELSNTYKNEKAKLTANFGDELFSENGKALFEKLSTNCKSFLSRLFGSDYKQIKKRLLSYNKTDKKINYKTALDTASSLLTYQSSQSSFSDLESSIKSYFSPYYEGISADWNLIEDNLTKLKDLIVKGLNCGTIKALSLDEYASKQQYFKDQSNQIKNCCQILMHEISYVGSFFEEPIFSIDDKTITSFYCKCKLCVDNLSQLENWVRAREVRKALSDNGADKYIDCILDSETPKAFCGNLSNSFKKTFYRLWCELIINSNQELHNFSRATQDNIVKSFAEKDALQFEISKAQIKNVLSEKRPTLDFISPGSATSIILREAEKKRRQKPIRVLLEETAELVQTIKPCFLMSPLSVSTFLSSDHISFDTVIFDEASQIFPQDAIGAIYRGKQLIVVGDSKQMPPSNFFNSTVDAGDFDDDEDEDHEDITDYESILDLCSVVFPQKRLNWHYRSRYEQLIAFSNKNFYNNSLMTFPSSEIDKKGIGVDYFYVDGIFDRKSHTNRAEAEFVVNLVFEHVKKYPNRSLGIVAFSTAQQDLIDRLISKYRQTHPEHEEFFSGELKEPFFVKNLETVQGDERDTIIFSIAYGKDAQNRTLMNFGPLNRIGGERRLNVAVSRAKCNIQVVSSMHHFDIDLSRTHSEGSRLLREYLDYAENGTIALERSIDVNPLEQFDSEFEMDVYDCLKSHGFEADTQVGCSGYKIDIALKAPNSSDYLLAIECDGASYHSSKNARDRDRLRQSVLEGMGWTFYRIWSTDWFKNNRFERERLLSTCRSVIESRINPSSKSRSFETQKSNLNDEGNMFELKQLEEHCEFPKYRTADVSWTGRYIDYVQDILEVEAPLNEEWLLQRTAYLFGREKVTSVVRSSYEYQMRNCDLYGIERMGNFLYLSSQDSYQLRVPGDVQRNFEFISLEELGAGIYTLVENNVRASKEGVFNNICNLLGFKRRTEQMTERLEEAMELYPIAVDGDILTIKD